MEHEEEYLTPTQTAKLLKVTTGCLANWRCRYSDKIPFVKPHSKCVVYKKSDVFKYLQKNTFASTSNIAQGETA